MLALPGQERSAKIWVSGWVVGGISDFVVATQRQKVAVRNKGRMEKNWRKRRGSPERAKGMPLMETHQFQNKLNGFKIVEHPL